MEVLVRGIVFEEERQIVIVPGVLNRINVQVEPEHVVIPDERIVNQHAELHIDPFKKITTF